MMRAHDCPVVESPDVLLAALERAKDDVVIVDSDLHVSHFNAAAERIWGLDRAEVLGRHVSSLGLGDLEPHPVATPASAQVNGGAAIPERGSEITIIRKDARPIRAALSLSRIKPCVQARTIPSLQSI